MSQGGPILAAGDRQALCFEKKLRLWAVSKEEGPLLRTSCPGLNSSLCSSDDAPYGMKQGIILFRDFKKPQKFFKTEGPTKSPAARVGPSWFVAGFR